MNLRGPYCDTPLTLGSGAVVRCGSEVAPGEAKFFQCDRCAALKVELLARMRDERDAGAEARVLRTRVGR